MDNSVSPIQPSAEGSDRSRSSKQRKLMNGQESPSVPSVQADTVRETAMRSDPTFERKPRSSIHRSSLPEEVEEMLCLKQQTLTVPANDFISPRLPSYKSPILHEKHLTRSASNLSVTSTDVPTEPTPSDGGFLSSIEPSESMVHMLIQDNQSLMRLNSTLLNTLETNLTTLLKRRHHIQSLRKDISTLEQSNALLMTKIAEENAIRSGLLRSPTRTVSPEV